MEAAILNNRDPPSFTPKTYKVELIADDKPVPVGDYMD